MNRVYLDHNATAPLRPEVREAIASLLSAHAGNPSSLHEEGRNARRAVDRAREEVAGFLGVPPEEVIFTSGGTEANHLAWNAFSKSGFRLATSAVEHASVLSAAKRAAERGASVSVLPVNREGGLDGEIPAVDLLSLQQANHETGILFPIVASEAEFLHVDGVQSAGKIEGGPRDLGADLFSISGHKLGALPGAGALAVRKGTPLEPLWRGGHQERDQRTGTENLTGIVALGTACRVLSKCLAGEEERIRKLRDRFESELLRRIPDAEITGANRPRLPNTSHVSFPNVDARSLLVAADLEGISVSTGSACASGSIRPSHVLCAMGFPPNRLHSAVRFSFGWSSGDGDVERALEVLPAMVCRARAANEKRVEEAGG